DGIRDFHVTGVQTCALPISRAERLEHVAGVVVCPDADPRRGDERIASTCTEQSLTQVIRIVPGNPKRSHLGTGLAELRRQGVARSEERRVGKAWRERWGPGR